MADLISGGRFRESEPKLFTELLERGFGIPDGESVVLSPAEALYLISKGRITAHDEKKKKFGFDSLMEFEASCDPLIERKYEVYRYLRENGHVARISKKGDDSYLRVYRKGKRIGDEPAKYLVKVVESSHDVKLGDIESEVRKASALRKELVLAGVETDGSVWFIKIGRAAFD